MYKFLYFFFFIYPSKQLGSGTYGAVFKGTHKFTKEPRAIKAIAKSKVKNPESFKNEIEIMKKLVSKINLLLNKAD